MKQANLTEAENNRLKAELQQKDGTLATQETQIQQNIEAEVKRQEEARKEAERKREEARKAAEKAAAEKAAAEKEASAKAKRSQDTTSQSQDPSTSSNVSLPDDTSTPTGSAADVVTVGNRWIGNSAYVFGGGRNQSDIANGLFDCSSFVHWAYSQVGIKLGPLGWVSTETLKHQGRQVSVGDMKPGDLVFFDTYKKDGHVGIYVGNHKFIGAQSAGVSIADMNSNYWSSHFNGRVVRIIN
nr:C40 family peptidase [Priestia koreensis]